MRRVPVTVTFLEMTSPADLRASAGVGPEYSLEREVGAGVPVLAEAMYRRVGAGWHWRDRLGWNRADWTESVTQDGVELWILREAGEAIGYFELARADSAVEIRYFGLAPEGLGKRLGGWLLTRATERAWALSPSRVVLNTCTLDGPAALPNYLARGYHVVRVQHQERELPE